MEIWQAVVLGVIEGVTEFLPISSTGHMILVSYLMGISNYEFVKTFEIVIQLGAILAVIGQYATVVLKNTKLLGKVILTFLPTGVLGVLMYDFIKGTLFSSPLITVITLVLGGGVIIFFERVLLKGVNRDNDSLNMVSLPVKKCIALGFIQALAMVPGVSRSGATIVGGMALGLSRREAAEFSFLMAVPTLFFASSWDLINTGINFSGEELVLLILGFMVSLIVAWLTVKGLINYLKKHTLEIFGWYRIVVGLAYGLVFLM